VRAITPQPHEVSYDMGRMLEIRIDQHGCIAPGQLQTGRKSRLFPEVAGQPDHPHPSLLGDLEDCLDALIGASVIDDDYLERRSMRGQRLRQGLDEAGHLGAFVENRDDSG
jgi:hypothetical protein